ncbi:hypothetical protein PFISCL1PPCAC_22168, partial [Pristionchus fissidentatus]
NLCAMFFIICASFEEIVVKQLTKLAVNVASPLHFQLSSTFPRYPFSGYGIASKVFNCDNVAIIICLHCRICAGN